MCFCDNWGLQLRLRLWFLTLQTFNERALDWSNIIHTRKWCSLDWFDHDPCSRHKGCWGICLICLHGLCVCARDFREIAFSGYLADTPLGQTMISSSLVLLLGIMVLYHTRNIRLYGQSSVDVSHFFRSSLVSVSWRCTYSWRPFLGPVEVFLSCLVCVVVARLWGSYECTVIAFTKKSVRACMLLHIYTCCAEFSVNSDYRWYIGRIIAA